MRTTVIVHVGYKTPVKPAIEKYSTVGTRGMGSAFSFKSRCVAAAK
jgi:hypothetical protein